MEVSANLSDEDLEKLRKWLKEQTKQTGDCDHCGERCVLTQKDEKCMD